MRFIISHLNLLVIISWFSLPLRQAQDIDSVWFPPNNFTNCTSAPVEFQVYSVNRYFDVDKSVYYLNFTSSSNTTVTSVNEQGTTYSSSKMVLKFGFKTMEPVSRQFCMDSVNGCPLSPQTNFTIERSFNLSNIPVYPLADITAQYSAITADSHLVCIQLAPVGYQHPTWRNIFTWLPIGFTAFAAILSLVASFKVFHSDDGDAAAGHDIFLFGSNYAMLPGVLRLKTPGFFDLVFYAQFIVTVGQFNIEYPRFHALFTSNFSWSFLLFNHSEWLNQIISSLFQASASSADSISSVPGQILNKRQEILNVTTDSNNVDVVGTGMADFAIATGIDINALFFTLMVYVLLIISVCLALCFIVWTALYVVGKSTDRISLLKNASKMWDFTLGVLVRILSLAYLPILTMSFYQLMIPSYWYITVTAALFLVIPFLFYGFVSIKLMQIRPASFIYTELHLLLRYGTLYNAFTDVTFHFFIWIIVYKSVVAAMIGLFQTSGLAQIILVLLAELALMVGLLIKLPFADNQVNFFHTVIGFIRILVLSLNIAYLPTVMATASVKQYVGYAQMAIHCFAFFLLLVLQIKNLVTIATGLGDDELDETGKPPARMAMWRKTKRPPHQLHVTSTATLMTAASRSQNPSFYMTNSNRNSNRLTVDSQTIDAFTNYYGQNSSATTSHAVLKPDEVTRLQHFGIETVNATNENMLLQYPSLVAEYMNNSTTASSSSVPLKPNEPTPLLNNRSTRAYTLDDEIAPPSEPLMAAMNSTLKKDLSPPPPLPKHVILNNDSTYSPPHEPSPTSLVIQDDV